MLEKIAKLALIAKVLSFIKHRTKFMMKIKMKSMTKSSKTKELSLSPNPQSHETHPIPLKLQFLKEVEFFLAFYISIQ